MKTPIAITLAVFALTLCAAFGKQGGAGSRSADGHKLVATDDLTRGFVTPPNTARPWVFWFRENGQITREGITRDFEQMRTKGIGGAIVWDNLVVGPHMAKVPFGVRWLDPQWWELYRHTIQEAERLGIGLSLQLCWNITCGGPWITPEHTLQKVVYSETPAKGPTTFHAILPKPQANWHFYRDIAVLAVPADVAGKTAEPVKNWSIKTYDQPIKERLPAFLEEPAVEVAGESRVPIGSVVDITRKMDGDGRLSWQVPEGEWVILRIGHTAEQNSRTKGFVAPDQGGFEVNVLSREAMDLHLRELAQKLIDAAGPAVGRTLQYLHTDSWEIPQSNWTPTFREDFQRRRGYDLLPYLPVLAGKLVESREVTNRFLWDFRRTIGDLIAENHYDVLREFSARHGMSNDCEAGGPRVHVDSLQCLGRSEAPMGEIWGPPLLEVYGLNNTTKQAASAAHIYGRKLAAAETFTTVGPHWEVDPFMMKPIADVAFGNGINRIVAHSFSHSPPEWGKPGLVYFAGSHQNPNVTWWEQSGAWYAYLARCDYLLQQGLFVADVCYFYGEGVPNYMPPRTHLVPALPAGYDYDGVNAEVLLTRMSVKDGRIVLPDGPAEDGVNMSYRLLVLPPLERMTPAVLKRVKELIEAGATVVGPKPVGSPSLSDYPHCDETVKAMADAIWGDCDGQKVKERTFGKGRIIWGKSLLQVLLAEGVRPDFDMGSGGPLWVWHAADSGPGPGEPPACDRWFKKEFEILAGRKVTSARVSLTADNAFEAHINGATVCRGDDWQTWVDADLAPWLHPGKNTLLVRATNTAPGAAGLIVRGEVRLDQGEPISLSSDETWLSSRDKGDWALVGVLGVYGCAPWGGGEANDASLTYTHRSLGGTDIYFIANRNSRKEMLDCTFGVRGKQPEIWDPITGEMRDAAAFKQANGRTTLPLEFAPYGSLFVVFRNPIATDAAGTAKGNFPILSAGQDIAGSWTVMFDPRWGGPESVEFTQLDDWSKRPEEGIKYYSGTATYLNTFDLQEGMTGKRAFLDLGRVKNVAEVRLNGKELGVVWTAPWQVEITEAVKPTDNKLEIDVVNLWPNRLIGDAALPPEKRRTKTNVTKFVHDSRRVRNNVGRFKKVNRLLESGLLGPVRVLIAE